MMKLSRAFCPTLVSLLSLAGQAQEAVIEVRISPADHPVSRLLTGACIEDVNHEIYGGLYSQMLFGESFQEPAPSVDLNGFTTWGGHWQLADGVLRGEGGDGPKLVSQTPVVSTGDAGVEIWFAQAQDGNAGLILKVNNAKQGADAFTGYEVSLETSGRLVLGRHRQNWEPLREVACDVPLQQWISLVVQLTDKTLAVQVNGRKLLEFEDNEHPLAAGTVGLRTWQREALFRNLWIKTNTQPQPLPFEPTGEGPSEVSSPWTPVKNGDVRASFNLVTNHPFVGVQSQRLELSSGKGEVGLANRGLNGWGLHFVADRPYEGCIWARSEQTTECCVALENGDGKTVSEELPLAVTNRDWQRLEFTLTAHTSVDGGRFSIKLKKPGAITLGYAFLQPGEWGRFHGLPVRRDVAQGLIDQGITVLRYGGSMVNAPEYRWKKMLGPHDRRAPYRGTWYPHSSNGWGIFDFLDFCEACRFVGIPDLNVHESPQDMADFIEYVNGSTNSAWGARRAAQGHPQPYGVKYIELGNEERVDEAYTSLFEGLAKTIWAKDPAIILVVGDFAYTASIEDPFHFTGADSHITSLAGQQRILQLAKSEHHEVWFDVHVWSDGPGPSSSLQGAISFRNALQKICDGAAFHVAIFELNANNHDQRRALGNAWAIQSLEKDGGFPVVTSANGLQPDGQNDNGWDQGLLFLNPSQVWLQPPGYVTQMISRHYQPLAAECQVTAPPKSLDAIATRSQDGKTLVLQVVNISAQPVTATLKLNGFTPANALAQAEELAGDLDLQNSANDLQKIKPSSLEWKHDLPASPATYSFPPNSFTILTFN